MLQACGRAVDRVSDRLIHHRHDAARRQVAKLGGREWSEQQNRLRTAGIAQRHRLVEFDHGKARDRFERLEHASDVDDSKAVAVVLDDRENRTAAGAARHCRHAPPQPRGVDFDPRVERGVLDGRRAQRARTRLRHRRCRGGFQKLTSAEHLVDP